MIASLLTVEQRPRFAKWQEKQREKATKDAALARKRALKVRTEEDAIMAQVRVERANGTAPGRDWMLTAFGLAYVVCLLNWASIFILGTPLF